MQAEKHKDALRTIGEVAVELGVATHVLRFWESKFSQIKPQKRRGRRYYDSKDVATIQTIKTLLYDQGYTIKGVHKYLNNNGVLPLKSSNTNTKPEKLSTPDDNFKHDSNGNIVADNQSEANNNKSGNVGFSPSELNKLHKIYNGLCEARKKLTGSNNA